MGIRSNLWCAAAVLASFAADAAGAVNANQEVPFRLVQELIVADGSIEGGHRVSILIDTGASCTVISERQVAKLNLPIMPYNTSFVAPGRKAERPMAVVRDISLGPIMTSRSCMVSEIPIPGVDLIIGLNVLRQHSFTIDL